MLPATAKFCNKCGQKLAVQVISHPKEYSFDEKLDKIQRYLPEGLVEKILSQKKKIEGERRIVTMMFCDMKGFTPLTESLGPDETFSLMDQVFEILLQKVNDYRGTVNELRGDGILAFFGAPIALEDAPQRAIRSALAIHKEIAKFNEKLTKDRNIPPVLLRIGINTGTVVVGTMGNDLRVQFTAVGDSINMAARMESLAEPGTTYVTQETFSLAEGFFRFEALGKKQVKGKEEPLDVYRVIAQSSNKTRFDVSAERGLTALVGRDRELELLQDGYRRIRSGRGSAFSIIAEAGMGKSRLLYEFRKLLANEDINFMEGKCLSYGGGVAYQPIIDIFQSIFNIREKDSVSEIQVKVSDGLNSLNLDEKEIFPYLLDLLPINDLRLDKLSTNPESKKAMTIEALKQVIIKVSEYRPLVIAFEDLHWVDESSEHVFKHILDIIPGLPILMVLTYRPDYMPSWIGKSYYSQLTLSRLSDRENQKMASDLLGDAMMDRDLEDLILDKTEGVPFFVEEFVKSFKDLKLIEKENEQLRLSKDIPRLTVPSTIQDVIMARVDKLPQGAKDVLQIGSVAGREFSLELIRMGMDIDEQELLNFLSALKDMELIYERGLHPESIYVFKHALTRDVIYNSILKNIRKGFHEKIGTAIEALYKENIVKYYGILAEHFNKCGNYVKCSNFSKLAAARSEKAGAINEAIVFTQKRIEAIENMPSADDQQKQIIDARVDLGRYWLQLLNYREAKGAIAPIITIAKQGAYKDRLPEILTIDGSYQMNVKEDAGKAFEHLVSAVNISKDINDDASLSLSSWRLGLTKALNCEFREATQYFNNSLRLMNSMHSPWGISSINSYLCIWGYGFQGKISQVEKTSSDAFRKAEENGDIYSKSMAYTSRGLYFYLKGSLDEAVDHLSKAIVLCEKIDFVVFNAMARIFLSELCYDLKDYQNSEKHHARALDILESLGIYKSWTEFHKLGVAKSKVMQEEDASDLSTLYGYVNKNKVKLFEAWKQRYIGEILFHFDESYHSEAEDWIKKAISSDERDGMKWYLARDLALLGSLYKIRGDLKRSKTHLSDSVNVFKECGADGWVNKYEKELAAFS
jgi:class 3 adenylate cyclase/tetratricopeptide (TPR) repeat protein